VTVMVVCIAAIVSGSILSFPSTLTSRDDLTNIYGNPITITTFNLDMLGSVNNFGALFGVSLPAFLVPLFGRKRILVAMSLVTFLGWVGVILSPTAIYMICFRFFTGCGFGGMNIISMAYVVELCDDNIRPLATLLLPLASNGGQMVGIAPALWLPYYWVGSINAMYPVIYLILVVVLLPRSPSALVVQGQEDKARKVMKKLGSSDTTIEERIKNYRQLNEAHKNANFWQSIKQPQVWQRLLIIYGLFTLQAFSGYPVFVSQTARAIQETGVKINIILGSMIVQSAQMAGTLINIGLISRNGRRGNLMLSQAVMAVSLAGIATYTLFEPTSTATSNSNFNATSNANALNIECIKSGRYFQSNVSSNFQNMDCGNRLEDNVFVTAGRSLVDIVPSFGKVENVTNADMNGDSESSLLSYIPLAGLMLTMIGSSIGFQSSPFILSSEYFPTAIRPQMVGLCIGYGRLTSVMSVSLYTIMQTGLSQMGLMYFYSAVCVLALPYSFLWVQETVGKNVG